MSSPSPPLRTGIAGFGMAVQVFHAPLLKAVDGFDIRAVSSSRTDQVRAAVPDAKIYDDAFALCRDPELDLIVVATPNDSHAALAEAALAAGKHVVVDKPFALKTAEARRVFAAAGAAGRIATAFQNRRWVGDFLTVQQVLRDGRVGRLVQLECRYDRFRPTVPDRWRDRPGPGSGLWYDLGPHLIDQALQLFGLPRTVWADIAVIREGATADDDFHLVLGYDRLRVVLQSTTLAAAPTPQFLLHGTAGAFTLFGQDPQEAQLKDGMIPGAPGWGVGAPDGKLVTADGEQTISRLPGDYRRFYEGVRDAITAGAPLPVKPVEVLDVMRILDAGRLSSRTGARIEMDSFERSA